MRELTHSKSPHDSSNKRINYGNDKRWQFSHPMNFMKFPFSTLWLCNFLCSCRPRNFFSVFLILRLNWNYFGRTRTPETFHIIFNFFLTQVRLLIKHFVIFLWVFHLPDGEINWCDLISKFLTWEVFPLPEFVGLGGFWKLWDC